MAAPFFLPCGLLSRFSFLVLNTRRKCSTLYSLNLKQSGNVMRTVIAIPPLPRMSGGVAVLYQLAARLQALNLPVALTSVKGNAPGLAAHEEAGFTVLPWGRNGNGLGLAADDCYLVPEGWPNMLAPGINASARNLVYVQNWAYLFSALPGNLRWQDLPVSFLAVSHPVAWFMETMAGLPVVGVLRPMIDTELFAPGSKPDDRVRIAWMPRKNKALAEQIRRIVTASLRASKERAPDVEWVEIHNQPPARVAEMLAASHIFLCTGFPEGIGLPPLEAMASGCMAVGFSGFGGWDYMRPARLAAYMPPFDLRYVPWSGNGFFVPDGEVIEAARALLEAVCLAACKAPVLEVILAQGRLTAASYSREEQLKTVQALWASFPLTLVPARS